MTLHSTAPTPAGLSLRQMQGACASYTAVAAADLALSFSGAQLATRTCRGPQQGPACCSSQACHEAANRWRAAEHATAAKRRGDRQHRLAAAAAAVGVAVWLVAIAPNLVAQMFRLPVCLQGTHAALLSRRQMQDF